MMGKIEAQEARGLTDVVTVHEQALGLVDDVVVDVTDGCSPCRLVDNVAEIPLRHGQTRDGPQRQQLYQPCHRAYYEKPFG